MSVPNILDYSTLNSYAVLAGNDIISVGGTTTISNGYYGAVNAITGSVSGTEDSTNILAAKSQLTNLIFNVKNYANTLPSQTLTSPQNNVTLYPSVKYTNSGVTTLTFTGSITLDGQGNMNSQFFIISSEKIDFNNISSINLINGATNCNIFWLAVDDITFLTSSPPSISGIFISETNDIIFANVSNILGRLYTDTGDITFNGSSSVNAICDVVCYAKGTLILTKNGFVPIEKIKAGHQVVTKGRIYKNKYINEQENLKLDNVIWISKFKVINLNSKTRPICIEKDAFAKNCPFQDLYVSPKHGFLLNGKMVLAKDLVNGKTIYQDNECEDVEYYHLECKYHSAIFANGVLSESYLDVNNRDIFENSIKIQNKVNLKNILSLR